MANATVDAAFSNTLFENGEQLAAFVITVYDYLLTVGKEVQLIWSGTFTIPKALFIVNRYCLFMLQILIAINIFGKQNVSILQCHVFYYMQNVLLLFSTAATLCIFALRTYAIFGRNNLILLVLGCLGLGTLSGTIYELCSVEIEVSGSAVTSCRPKLQVSKRTNLISPIFALLFDSLVFILTVSRAGHSAYRARKVGLVNSLAYKLARDGYRFYIVNFIPAIESLISINSNPSQSMTLFGVTGDLSATLRGVMTNRLVLLLSQIGQSDEEYYNGNMEHSPTPILFQDFAGTTGSIGASIPSDVMDEWDDDDR